MARRPVRQLLIRLRPDRDADLVDALSGIPAGEREARLRDALRWYFVPGGFADVLAELAAVRRALAAAPLPAAAPPDPPSDAEAAIAAEQEELLAHILAAFPPPDGPKV
jgi:hypothetical protein